MKRLLWILLILLVLECLALPCAGADENDFEYRISTDENGVQYATIIRGKAQKNLVIPAEIDGYPVYEIGDNFARLSEGMTDHLVTLVIEPGVKWIGTCAFQYCKALTTVTLPEGLETIASCAFGDNMALTGINFPEGIRSIGFRAFGWCHFSEANLPDTVEIIDDTAFCCVPLTSLRLSENLKTIGKMAFEYNQLTSLYIPASVRTVGNRSFSNAEYLQKVVVAGEDTAFELDAFSDEYNVGIDFELVCAAGSGADIAFADFPRKKYDLTVALGQIASGVGLSYREGDWVCIRLEDGTGRIVDFPRNQSSLVFPSSVCGIPISVIGKSGVINAEGYEKVSSVTIPEGVTRIDAEAFSDFKALKSVKLPGSLKYIGKEAFARCDISSIQLPDGLEEIAAGAFSGNHISQLTLPSALRAVGEKAFYWCEIKKLVLPDGLEEIGMEAFWPFHGKKLTIPASVSRIGSEAFGPNGQPAVWTVIFLGSDTAIDDNAFGDSGNPYYCEALSYEIPGVTVKCFPGSAADRYFRFDCIKRYQKWTADRILTVPADRVLTSSSLVSDTVVYEVIIPEGVEEIADGAFSEAKSVAKVTLPSTLKHIGKEAFAGGSLLEVSIPDAVEEIDGGAFRDCVNLFKVSISSGSALKRIGNEAFKSCARLKSITLPKGLAEIGAGAFSESALTEASVPDTVTVIGEGAFAECAALVKIKLPVSLTVVPDRLCALCRELKSVNIPAGVTRIGVHAFRRCRLISSLTFPEGLEEICDGAFEQFDGGAQMGWSATKGRETYTRLKKIKLPSTLKVIGKGAFYACDAVGSVTFAKGCALTEIDDGAFVLCTHLKSIALPDSVLTVGQNAFVQCFSLTKVNLGAGLTTLGENAFRETPALTSLIVPDTLAEIGQNVLTEHGARLTVTCGEGSAMESWLREYQPGVKIVRP